MATTLPQLDSFLARDHTSSIVVDIPYGLRGGVALVGSTISPQALLIATDDHHPRAISYTAWVSGATTTAVERHPFYLQLLSAENGIPAASFSRPQIRRARADLRAMDVGWIVEWRNMWTAHHPRRRFRNINLYLARVGLRRTHRACIGGPRTGCPSLDQAWLYQQETGRP